MQRYNALTIKLEPWMLKPEFLQYVDVLQIEATETAAQRGETPVIWVGNYDETIFQLAQGEMEILKNLRLWYDDVENQIEVRINEHNYKEYDSALYYKIRTGKYDVDVDM